MSFCSKICVQVCYDFPVTTFTVRNHATFGLTHLEVTLVMFKGNPIYLSYPKPKLLTGFILEGNFLTWQSIGPNETENFTKEEDALCPIEFWNQRISAITHNSIL